MSTLLIILIATFIPMQVAEIVYLWYAKKYIDLCDYEGCLDSYGYFMANMLWKLATYSKTDILIYVLVTPLRMLIAPLNFACHLFIGCHSIYYNVNKLNED